jgi:hypothetical protein
MPDPSTERVFELTGLGAIAIAVVIAAGYLQWHRHRNKQEVATAARPELRR